MNQPLARIARKLLPVVGLACSGEPTAPLPASLTTDAVHYVAVRGGQFGPTREYSFTLVARFTNTSRYTVHLSRCFQDTPYPIYGILTADGDTTAAYDPSWGCVGGLHFLVAPGESRVDTLPVRAPWGVDATANTAMGVFEGRFVLIYEMYGCADETPQCTTPVYGNARSGVFTVSRRE